MIWGVKLGCRPARRGNLGGQIGPATSWKSNLGDQIGPATSRKSNLGGQIRPATSRKANLGDQIGSATSWKGNLGDQIRSATSRKDNLGGQIGLATSRRGNLGGRIRLFTCFTPKTFTQYLIVEGIGTPIFFENKVIDLLDGLSKGARFRTRAGRKWKQEHMLQDLKAWKWKEAPPSPLLSG